MKKSDNISSSNDSPESIITNVVCTANLGRTLNIKEISMRCTNVIYKEKRNQIIISEKSPKATVMIFQSGKLICTGAKSEEDSTMIIKKVIKQIKKLGYDVKLNDFKIANIVATYDAKFKINLRTLYDYLSTKEKKNIVHYEPECFPAIKYSMDNPKVNVSIFSSGKIILVGAKEKVDINSACNKIYPLLLKFRNSSQEKKDK